MLLVLLIAGTVVGGIVGRSIGEHRDACPNAGFDCGPDPLDLAVSTTVGSVIGALLAFGIWFVWLVARRRS